MFFLSACRETLRNFREAVVAVCRRLNVVGAVFMQKFIAGFRLTKNRFINFSVNFVIVVIHNITRKYFAVFDIKNSQINLTNTENYSIIRHYNSADVNI